MNQVSKVINLFNNPDGDAGFLRQIVSFNDTLYQNDPMENMVQIANAMFIKADQDILDRKDPESRFPTIRDMPWDGLDEKLREIYKEDLYLWGENTRIAERFWHYSGDDVQAVVVRTGDGRDVAYQSSGRNSELEIDLLRREKEKLVLE